MTNARQREADATIPVYGQLPFVPESASGCEILTQDGRRILDLYGGHAVAALGYAHAALVDAITEQAKKLLFQSNAVALDIRAEAAEKIVSVAPENLQRAFFVNSGAEANENALRIACKLSGRKKVLAISHGFHGRTAAAAAVTWQSEKWYGFPATPFDVDFIPRDDVDAAKEMINDEVAAVIFEPVQGIAGAYDLSREFLEALRTQTRQHGAFLIADEVQSGMGRCGEFFAVQIHSIEPDLLTSAKALGGGVPCGAVLCSDAIASELGPGDLGSTFGGGPIAAAAIVATIDAIRDENLLENVRAAEKAIRASCITGPVVRIQGKGLLLGLVCNDSVMNIRNELLENDILVGTSNDPAIIRILAPLILNNEHIERLATALGEIAQIDK